MSTSETGTPPDERRDDRTLAATRRECEAFVQEFVADAGADGVVVALSGGIDSTTAATLAVNALGPDGVYGLVLPAEATSETNRRDAQRVARELGIDFRTVDVQPVVDAFVEAMTREVWLRGVPTPSERQTVVYDHVRARNAFTEALGNVAVRIRMAAAYFEANTTDRLVLGTGNRTERLLGYFTKFGDGGADLLPLGDVYKTEVRGLAMELDVPEDVVRKPPTAGLRSGQTDEADLGACYGTIDSVLWLLVEEGYGVDETAAELGVDRTIVERFAGMYAESAHKRTLPPTPSTYVENDPG